MDDLGSKILIGKDMWVIVNPCNMFLVNYLRTSTSTPFYLSIASLSMQINPPYSCSFKPFKIWFFSTGNFYSKILSSKYLGGGHFLLYGYLLSTKELWGTETWSDKMNGLFMSSCSSGSSGFPRLADDGCLSNELICILFTIGAFKEGFK